MITTTYEWRGQQILRVTVIVSLLVHLIAFVFAFWALDLGHKLFPHAFVKPPAPKDEIVTISSALSLDKKPVLVRVPRPVKPPTAHPPAPQTLPQRAVIAQQFHQPKVEPPAPSLQRHELAKQSATAPPNPAKTIHQRIITDEPSAPPRTPPPHTPPPVQRVAQADDFPVSAPQRASSESQFSQEQLAKIDRDLQRTIAQARSANNPLRVTTDPPAAPKHYRIQMEGAPGQMRNGQGLYYPVKSWRVGGYDYYYVSYEYTYPDGTYETGSVPWPIRFLASEDPFTHPEIGSLNRTPLPGPPPGYTPPADLGKALRPMFPGLYFDK